MKYFTLKDDQYSVRLYLNTKSKTSPGEGIAAFNKSNYKLNNDECSKVPTNF